MSATPNLDMALSNARQNITLLRSQIQAGQIDGDYFLRRLDAIGKLLEDVSTERQGQQDTERFAKLYQVSRAIGSSLDLQEVLNQVMDAIITLTGAERGFLMLLNDDGVLEVQVARNFDQESLESNEVMISRTITRQVFERGEPIVTTNATEDPRFSGQASVIAHQLRSIMAAPMRSRGSIIGVVYVDNRVRTGLFREKDLELLEAFTAQAAVSIDNARLFSETDEKLARRVEELTTLQWIDRQLNETLDISKAMDLTVEWAIRMVQARSASLAMHNPDDETLQVMSHAGEVDNLTSTQQHIPMSNQLILKVMESGQPAIQKSPADLATPYTLFCVPIRRENKTIGVMLVTANREEAFDADSQALITRLADRAAIAIENGRLYNELKRANQAKSEFVGTVAHELKAPMTSISGYSDLILQFGNLDGKQLNHVERIKGGVRRMQQLVDDLSDISRIESGHLRVELTDVDLKEVIEQVKAGVITEIEDRQHQLNEQIDPGLPPVKADPARMVQVLTNLVSNAYKYTPNGGQISIRAVQNNGSVEVSVQDTGVGMSTEELEKLGTKFWRSSNSHSLKQRGTGLGFSITRQLVELMGFTLDIQSQQGQGSTFTISIPLNAAGR